MNTPNSIPPAPPGIEPKPRLKVQFDWRDWLPYVAASGASEDQKRELIETLWAIVLTFVDQGWEVGSATPVASDTAHKESCGQDLDLTAALASAVLTLEKQSDPNAKARRDEQRTAPPPLSPGEAEDAA